MKKLISIAVLSLALVACGDNTPKLDASNDASMKASVAKVVEKLSADKKEEFQKSLMALAFASAVKSGGDTAKTEKALMELVDGKSADEVIKMAQDMRDAASKKG